MATTDIVVISENFETRRIAVPAGRGNARYWGRRILDLVDGVRLAKWGEMDDPSPFSEVGLRGGVISPVAERTAG